MPRSPAFQAIGTIGSGNDSGNAVADHAELETRNGVGDFLPDRPGLLETLKRARGTDPDELDGAMLAARSDSGPGSTQVGMT